MRTHKPELAVGANVGHWLGIDQFGCVYKLGVTAHPRKALLCNLRMSSAKKMYVDYADGSCKHIGYVVGGRWIALYKRMENEG